MSDVLDWKTGTWSKTRSTLPDAEEIKALFPGKTFIIYGDGQIEFPQDLSIAEKTSMSAYTATKKAI